MSRMVRSGRLAVNKYHMFSLKNTLACSKDGFLTLEQAWVGCMTCITNCPHQDRALCCAGAEPAHMLK